MKNIFPLFIFFLSFFWFLFPKNALASTYYISPTGNDSASGSFQAPWRTFSKAMTVIIPGDTLEVRGGTYAQSINPKAGTQGLPVTIIAAQGETPIISGSGTGSGVNLVDKSYVIIDGLTITNFNNGLELANSTGIIIRNTILPGNKSFGIDGNTVVNSEFASNTVTDTGTETTGYSAININGLKNSLIHHNTVARSRHNGIVISYASDNNEIYNNTAYQNSCGNDQRFAGIAVEVDSEYNKIYNNLVYNNCHGGYVTNSPNNEIYHNLFYGNYEDGASSAQIMLGDWVSSAPSNNVFKNNIVVSTRSGDRAVGMGLWDGISYDPWSNVFENNLYYSTVSQNPTDLFSIQVGSPQGEYSFSQWQARGNDLNGKLGNPLFTNASTEDFHITSTSPAFDSGVDVSIQADFENVSRPQGAGADIGPYEVEVTPARQGDANGDFLVNGTDYVILLVNFMTSTTEGSVKGDFNNSGFVDGKDYVILLKNFDLN